MTLNGFTLNLSKGQDSDEMIQIGRERLESIHTQTPCLHLKTTWKLVCGGGVIKGYVINVGRVALMQE